MFFAELNEDNVCIGIKDTMPDAETVAGLGHKIVEIDNWDDSLHFKIYDPDTETWSDPPQDPEPEPQPKPTILDEIKSMMLVTINNLATIYPEQVDAELLAVLIQEGKRKIEDAPPDKRAEVQELIKKEV